MAFNLLGCLVVMNLILGIVCFRDFKGGNQSKITEISISSNRSIKLKPSEGTELNSVSINTNKMDNNEIPIEAKGKAHLVAPDSTNVTGTCSSKQQVVTYLWKPKVESRTKLSLWLRNAATPTNNVTFVLAIDDELFYIKNVVGQVFKDTKTFPDMDENEPTLMQVGDPTKDLLLLPTSLGHSRTCAATTSVALGNVTVNLSQLKLQVFQNNSDPASYGSPDLCDKDIVIHILKLPETGGDLVAVVGVLVAAFLIIAIVGIVRFYHPGRS